MKRKSKKLLKRNRKKPLNLNKEKNRVGTKTGSVLFFPGVKIHRVFFCSIRQTGDNTINLNINYMGFDRSM